MTEFCDLPNTITVCWLYSASKFPYSSTAQTSGLKGVGRRREMEEVDKEEDEDEATNSNELVYTRR